jgi:hypothetical protein
MVNKTKEASSVVKIDPDLLEKVEYFINLGENRFRFSNKKQFIDLAVYEFLEKNEKTSSKLKSFEGKGGKNDK